MQISYLGIIRGQLEERCSNDSIFVIIQRIDPLLFKEIGLGNIIFPAPPLFLSKFNAASSLCIIAVAF